VIYVEAGDAFSQSSESVFVIRPRVKDDYERLVGELKTAGKKPGCVMHLWNVDAAEHQPSLDELDDAVTRSFYSPFFIEQAFIKHNVLDDLRVIVAASGALDIAGEGVQSPVKALSMGTCRVLGKEFPMTRSRFVDTVAPRNDQERKSLAENLIQETRLDTDDTVAAYRNGYRWTESFETIHLDSSDGLQTCVKDDGVYLITGGLGGLGLLIARRFAQMAKVSFVLTHRSPMPERDEWRQWLDAHAQDDPTSEKIRGVVELEEAGATVMLAHADATDFAAMSEIKRDAREKFGKIDGVIHSAGTPGGGIISLKTEQMVAEVIDPKVRGTLVLDELFRDEPLDFLFLFSSITSVLGEAGRVDYCAANCFMDAYAQQHQKSRRVRSLNWGSWGEVGMAARWEESKAKRSLVKPQPRTNGNFLQLIRKGDGQEIYDVLLDAEKDWMVNGHHIFGIPTLVGATFLEIVRQFAEIKSPGSSPVLENMYFVSPLMFEPGKEKRLRLFIREGAGKYRFTFKSQAVEKNENKDLWHDHFTGDLLINSSPESRRLDIAALSARLGGVVDRGPFFFALKGNGKPLAVEFGERWQTLKELNIGEREWLAKLELDESLAGDLQEFAFHPALTDVAIAAAVKHVTQAAYLPYAYKRIELKSPYTRNLWSHIRLNGDYQPGGEIVSFDVTIMDAEGKELVTVERYNLRKVNVEAAEQQQSQHQSNGNGHKPAAEQARKSLARPKDILPEEGLDALSRILGAPYVPQIIIGTSDLGALIEEAKPTVKKATKDEPAEDGSQKTPAYSRPSLSTPYEEPANEVERAIVDIWRGILGIDQIGVNDDFTALGGNSLLAVQTVANIADAFQVDLPIESFFKRTTARGVAETVLELLVSMAGEETLEDLISALEE
jgi:NAD(P)-dependent dehydrogenase (short-subunit alcohol dehydrogenase family)/acyl carrier protein